MAKREKNDILVANPSIVMLSLVVGQVRGSDFANVRECSSSREVFNSLRRRSYDAIILSDTLIAPDWRRSVRMLRSGRFCSPDIPIILVCIEKSENGMSAIAQNHNVYPVALSQVETIQETITTALAEVPKSKILIIEDDPAIAKLACRALEKDFDVTVCNEGGQGIAAWSANEFDLVLLDLMLPDISGEEILECIINQKPEQMVIIVTAHGNIDRHQRLIEKGAFDFVDKPFDINRLRTICLQMISERVYVEVDRTTMEFQCRLNRVGLRIHAASADLKRGRVAIAAQHLDHACIEQPMNLSDDEWTELIAEFDQ